MEQVKGVSYSLNEFLGPAYWQNGGPQVQLANQTAFEYEKSLLMNKDTDLFHCVIYLAPGIFLEKSWDSLRIKSQFLPPDGVTQELIFYFQEITTASTRQPTGRSTSAATFRALYSALIQASLNGLQDYSP